MKARDTIELYAAIGDLKLVDYTNTLAVATLIRLLVHKGVITDDEFRSLAESLDAEPLSGMPLTRP